MPETSIKSQNLDMHFYDPLNSYGECVIKLECFEIDTRIINVKQFLLDRTSFFFNYKKIKFFSGSKCYLCGGMVEWLTHWTSNLRIASHMGSNLIRDKPLFP